MSKKISVYPVRSDSFGRVLYSTAILNFGYSIAGSLGEIDLTEHLSLPERDSLTAPKRLGEIDYNLATRGLSCSRYYPFGLIPNSNERRVLLGKGIADKIELFVLKDLLHKFGPSMEMIVRGVASDRRLEQFYRRRIKTGKKYPLGEYVRLLEQAMR
jgi:hypothetical protein